MDKQLAIDVGNRLRVHRNRVGISQEELAQRAGVHSTYIGQLERGMRNVTIGSLEKIIKTMGVGLDEFFECFGDDEDSSKSIPKECYETIIKLPAQDQVVLRDLIQTALELANK